MKKTLSLTGQSLIPFDGPKIESLKVAVYTSLKFYLAYLTMDDIIITVEKGGGRRRREGTGESSADNVQASLTVLGDKNAPTEDTTNSTDPGTGGGSGTNSSDPVLPSDYLTQTLAAASEDIQVWCRFRCGIARLRMDSDGGNACAGRLWERKESLES